MRGARRARAIGGALAVASLLSACDGSYDLPSAGDWESTHFTYRKRASDESICPDVLGPLEEHFALLQSHLGFDWPSGAKVTYEKMADGTDFEAHSGCGSEAGACTIESMVISAGAFDLHELVHAYLWQTGLPPTVLVEGAAVVLACQSSAFAQPKPTETWDELASLGYDPSNAVYTAGAWLVGFLLARYDPRLFTEVYQRLPSDADAGTMDAAFRDVYGQSLEALWTAALAESQPLPDCLWQCSRPPIPLDGTPVDSAGVCGGVDVFHPFTLASASVIGLSAPGEFLEVAACGPVPLPDSVFNAGLDGGVLGLYALPAGSYYVDSSPGGGTVALNAGLASALAPSCAQATDAAIFDGVANVFVTVPSSQPSWFLPLPPPSSQSQRLTLDKDLSAATATVCASCDPSSCAALPADGSDTWSAGQTVSIQTDPTQPFNQLFVRWIF